MTALSNEPYELEAVGLSDRGSLRSLNEDAFAIDTDHGFALVADGMGGHNAGEVASRLVTEVLHQALTARVRRFRSGVRLPGPVQFAEHAVARANRALLEAAATRPDYRNMGTTLALLLLVRDRIVLLHVGDSRIYRLRGGGLEQLSRDDSLLADQLQLGLISTAEAKVSHNRHFVTAALGHTSTPDLHVQETDVQCGDIYLLCTDGLSDLVDHQDMELIVDRLRTNLPLAAEHLVQLANDLGGNDNITVVLAGVRTAASGKGGGKGLIARLLRWLGR